MVEVLYTAAHAEFPDTEPLGGGKAIADYLIREWRHAQPFPLTVLSPHSLKLSLTKPLAEMTELEYARFCRQFERAATGKILGHDPQTCVVLSNDISEGPNFAALGQRGYRIVTIFHVDVVEYFTRFYLRNLVRPEWLAKLRWFGVMPDVLRLVFEKQYECVRYSTRIVVPSAPMRETILRCYPRCPPKKITVLPWGNIATRDQSVATVCRPDPSASPRVECDRRLPVLPEESTLTERRYNLTDDEFVILTLSRLSPEKGIERLLQALRHLGTVNCRLRVLICGGPAYMKGRAYERKLRRLATRITNIPVEFLGHVTGEQKAALLQRADLFVSPSRHESYGLAIAEVQAAGCRVISHHHYGASGTVVDCSDPAMLANAVRAILATGRTQKTAATPSPSRAAEELAELLVVASKRPMLSV